MTGISPLQSIHKKGLFGDHHKKNESDLLNIYEFKNLNIVQIFHYKNSKVKKDEISIESLELPSNSPQVTSNKDTRILWSSPNTWIVLSTKEDIIKIIKEKCDEKNKEINLFTICEICGSVQELLNNGLKNIVKSLSKDNNFLLKNSVLELNGVCSKCKD